MIAEAYRDQFYYPKNTRSNGEIAYEFLDRDMTAFEYSKSKGVSIQTFRELNPDEIGRAHV